MGGVQAMKGLVEDEVPECEHHWRWGDGRNAGSAECRRCGVWQPASTIEYDLRAKLAAVEEDLSQARACFNIMSNKRR